MVLVIRDVARAWKNAGTESKVECVTTGWNVEMFVATTFPREVELLGAQTT
jgi:hypothetical protein